MEDEQTVIHLGPMDGALVLTAEGTELHLPKPPGGDENAPVPDHIRVLMALAIILTDGPLMRAAMAKANEQMRKAAQKEQTQ